MGPLAAGSCRSSGSSGTFQQIKHVLQSLLRGHFLFESLTLPGRRRHGRVNSYYLPGLFVFQQLLRTLTLLNTTVGSDKRLLIGDKVIVGLRSLPRSCSQTTCGVTLSSDETTRWNPSRCPSLTPHLVPNLPAKTINPPG